MLRFGNGVCNGILLFLVVFKFVKFLEWFKRRFLFFSCLLKVCRGELERWDKVVLFCREGLENLFMVFKSFLEFFFGSFIIMGYININVI